MNTPANLTKQIDELQELLRSLENKTNYCDKLIVLNAIPIVHDYLRQSGPVQTFLRILTPESEFAMKSIIAIGQAPVVFNTQHLNEDPFKKLLTLLEQLLEIELFYDDLGGIIGYHLTVLMLILRRLKPQDPLPNDTDYIRPEGIDLGEDSRRVREAVRRGIEHIPDIAAIYPLGGAGDRLNLIDEKTGHSLPAALLPFLGRTLLEGMVRDLQGEEYLFFKLFDQQPLTPIVIMTSAEKDNHLHVLKICQQCGWFGRPSQSFHFFLQPLVPMITATGNWSLSTPLTLTLKPCGHGILWKLAEEKGVFKWLESQERHQCFVRQINNPLAGTDHALIALIGRGCHENKAFGFLSCERFLNSDEGINILMVKKVKNRYDYCLTNIEYPEFAQRGICETPAELGSPFSLYPANTNILFADIRSVRQALKICPIPGQLINMKSIVSYIDPQGEKSDVQGGRLECTMQNIADSIIDHFPQQLDKNGYREALQTFILYHPRSKTISTTKRPYQPGESPFETCEQAFYDMLSNHYSLLQQCGFELPAWKNIEQHMQEGPACIFLFHPALGPLYSIIAQKIRKGRIGAGGELQLEIAEVDIEELSIEGSLVVKAISPLGIRDVAGILQYGQESRCTLRQVKIQNRGINRNVKQYEWKNEITRAEEVEILLHEGAEFHAEGMTLEGSHRFEVPPHHRLVLSSPMKGRWKEEMTAIEAPTWHWRYSFDSEDTVQLTKIMWVDS